TVDDTDPPEMTQPYYAGRVRSALVEEQPADVATEQQVAGAPPDGRARLGVILDRTDASLRVRVVAAEHEEVARLVDETRRLLVRKGCHAHLAGDVLTRPHRQIAQRAALEGGVECECPVEMAKKERDPLRGQLHDA